MDTFDHKIIQALQHNARQSVSEIAKQVNLSRSAVSERIKRLEESRHILGYQAICKTSEDRVKAFFEIRYRNQKCHLIVPQILRIKGIKQCFGISGELDILASVEVSSIEQLTHIHHQLEHIEHIDSVTTRIVMNEWSQGQ